MLDPKNSKLFHRELSWIQFNRRVLAEGMDSTNPVLERLKFIGIVSSNFDEFFMVRVASLKEHDDVYHEVHKKAYECIDQQQKYFHDVIVPELAQAGIQRLQPMELSQRQYEYAQNYFQKELLPVLTPIAVVAEKSFPVLINLSLYMTVCLVEPENPGQKHYAVIEIPKNYSRIINLPSEKGYPFLLLEDIIAMFAKELFAGYQIIEQGYLRLTRAAEMTLDEEKDEDFAKVMTEALRMRNRSEVMRAEIAGPKTLQQYFILHLKLAEEQIQPVAGWFDLKTVSSLAFQPLFEDLKKSAWTPKAVVDFENSDHIWDLIRSKDVWVHHPYESFEPVTRFISDAADDPDVLAIKQTLYRASADSKIINALARAAEKGKRVTVLVELKARFDEEKNIEWARRLENAGASVLYGVVGLKTHSKACLVVRREPDGIRRYVHLGTGNYNEKTAQIYSDMSLFTADEEMAKDISAFFNMVTGFSHPGSFSKIEVAPFGLRKKIKRLIVRETMLSTKSEPGLIIAKMNSLVDPDIIDSLYEASKAGVKVQLNVRGVCCLRPGVKGMSENIEVISVVDMFLEHSRVFYFKNAGDEELYLASADWMPRNLDRRIEIMFPIENKEIRRDMLDVLKTYFKDNQKAWILHSNGEYKKVDQGSDKKIRAQEIFCKKATEREDLLNKQRPTELKPQKPR